METNEFCGKVSAFFRAQFFFFLSKTNNYDNYDVITKSNKKQEGSNASSRADIDKSPVKNGASEKTRTTAPGNERQKMIPGR